MTNWQDKLIQYIDDTKDFLLENSPSFFMEIAAYGRAKSMVVLVLLPILFVGGLLTSYKSFKIPIFDKYDDLIPGQSGHILLRIAGLFISFVSACVFMACIDDALMCWFAPKLYILRQISGK